MANVVLIDEIITNSSSAIYNTSLNFKILIPTLKELYQMITGKTFNYKCENILNNNSIIYICKDIPENDFKIVVYPIYIYEEYWYKNKNTINKKFWKYFENEKSLLINYEDYIEYMSWEVIEKKGWDKDLWWTENEIQEFFAKYLNEKETLYFSLEYNIHNKYLNDKDFKILKDLFNKLTNIYWIQDAQYEG